MGETMLPLFSLYLSHSQCSMILTPLINFLQNKRDEHILKRRNVPAGQDTTDSEDNEKPMTQSLEDIVQNASSDQPSVQLNAVQAAR